MQSRLAIEIQLLEPVSFSVQLNGQACPVERRDELTFDVPVDLQQLETTNHIEIKIEIGSEIELAVNKNPPMPDGSDCRSCVPTEARIGHHYLHSVALRIE